LIVLAFGHLIESIRDVVEGNVDAIDSQSKVQKRHGKRGGIRGSDREIKQQRSRMIRRDAKQKIAKGEPENIRRDVRDGYSS